jgi:hypothetical protein
MELSSYGDACDNRCSGSMVSSQLGHSVNYSNSCNHELSWARIFIFALILAGALTACLSAGCNTGSYKLGPEWAPLESIDEASWVSEGMVTTIEPHSYTNSLKDLLGAYPPDGVWFKALMLHEQVHAVRERQQGPMFYVEYAAFDSFRWEEEKLGYGAEIQYLRAHGIRVNPGAYARVMADKYSGMVNYDVALAWVTSQAYGN